jgi:hypothetical protein
MSEKSSFLKRQLSKEDAIIQLFRPQLAGRVSQAFDIFERIVNEAETLTKLGTVLRGGNNGETFHLTPDDLKANLDEYPELEQLAIEGRKFLVQLGYQTQRKVSPMVGQAPVGKTVDVQPISTQLPGSEPLEGVIVKPKGK